jgi:hypothetical protein
MKKLGQDSGAIKCQNHGLNWFASPWSRLQLPAPIIRGILTSLAPSCSIRGTD